MDTRLSLDVLLCGKKMQINIACVNSSAKSEIEELLCRRDLDIKDILKAYIQKTQECAELQDSLLDLVVRLENI